MHFNHKFLGVYQDYKITFSLPENIHTCTREWTFCRTNGKLLPGHSVMVTLDEILCFFLSTLLNIYFSFSKNKRLLLSDQFNNRKLPASLEAMEDWVGNEEVERKEMMDLGSFCSDHIYQTSPSVYLSKYRLYPITTTAI